MQKEREKEEGRKKERKEGKKNSYQMFHQWCLLNITVILIEFNF